MKTTSLVTMMGVIASVVVCACGDDGQLCVRGGTQPCACPGGTTGAQVCSADGQGWESCVCDWPDAGPDAVDDTGPDAVDDAGPDTIDDTGPDAGPDVDDADIGGDTGVECGEPTLEQCQDPIWLETDVCGMAEHEAMQVDAESVCNQLLLEEADRLSEEAEEEEAVLPDELGGGTGMVREEDNPERRLDEVSLPLTYVGFTHETAVDATETGLSAEEQALRDQWDDNGNQVASCREYVYEKYYDYTRFQDAVSARHDDSQYLADVAFGSLTDPVAIGTRAANGESLLMRDGIDMTVQTLEGRVCHPIQDCQMGYGSSAWVQNIFLAMPVLPMQWSEVGTSIDSNLRMYLENERCYMTCDPMVNPPPPPWQWHMDKHTAALEAGLSDIEMDAMYPRVLAFREALEDYAWITRGGSSMCCPLVYDNPPPSPGSACYPVYTECVSIIDRLIALFEEAYEAGCIIRPPATATVCDWSPAYFVETLRASFDAAMEADYQRCLDLTGDDFDALTDFEFIMPDENPWAQYPATDYTTTASDIDLFFSRHEEYRNALFNWYIDRLPRSLFNEQTGEVRAPGNEWSNNLRNSNAGFGVFLDYLLSWGLTDFDPEGGQTQADLCLVGFEAVGSLTMGGWAFWSASVDIIDAYAKLGLASGDGSEGHLIILGQEIWGVDPVEEWLIARTWSQSRTLCEKEVVIKIYGVPVGKLTGGVAGTLGLDVGAEVTGGRNFTDSNANGHVDPGETCSLDPHLLAWFTPWARLEAIGTMGPYIGIAEAGIRIDLMIVRLDLPFTLDIGLDSAPEMDGSVIFDVTVGADLVVRTLDGSISAYAKLGICPFCYMAKKVLFSWAGLQWAWDLFETSYIVPVGYLLEVMRPWSPAEGRTVIGRPRQKPRKRVMKAPKRPLIVLVSVSVALVAIVAVVLYRSPPDPTVPPSSGAVHANGGEAPVRPDSPAPFTFRWPAGTVYTYSLSMEAAGTVAPAGLGGQDGQAPLSGLLALDAELALRSYGRLDDRGDFVLGVQLVRLTRLDWTLGSQPVLADGGRSLTGRELALVVSPDGTFLSVNARTDDPPILVNLLRDVLGPLQVIVSPGQRAWTTEETSSVGELRVAYEVSADGPARLALQRRPLQYTRLVSGRLLGVASTVTTGAFEVVLDRAGHLDSVAGDERISADGADGRPVLSQELRIEARLLSVTRVDGGLGAAERLASLESTELDDVTTLADADQILLEQRAGDLTMEKLVDDLFIHGPATTFPDAGRWMWQATGLLLLHPELCGELVDVFEAPQMNRLARARILDLLASTGNPEAQAVLCQLLETPEATESERYELLVQRLSLVEEPTLETLDYLRAQVEQGDGQDSLAAAHSLGAALGNRFRAEGEVDERSAALLRQGLAEATSAEETAGWLGTLGNAGLVEDVSLVAGYAANDDPTVRSAVAGALRKMQSPEAEATLLDLVADPDTDVQSRALHTLTGYAITPAHLDALHREVQSGHLEPGNFAMLMTLLERNQHQSDAVLPVLDSMLGQDLSNRRLLLRIRALHEDLSSDR